MSVEPVERLLAVARGHHLEALGLEVAREHLAHHRLVVDDQDPLSCINAACTTVLSGTVTETAGTWATRNRAGNAGS